MSHYLRLFIPPSTISFLHASQAATGFFRSIVSGEGIVSEFTGPGELRIQTRNLAAFAGIMKPFFPTQSGSGGGLSIGGLLGNDQAGVGEARISAP